MKLYAEHTKMHHFYMKKIKKNSGEGALPHPTPSGMGIFRGGGGRPPIENLFAPFKYSLSWFLPNNVYNLCRIA